LKDGRRLFLEPSNPNSVDVFHKHGYRAIFGSDVIDWANYEKSQFGELRFYVDNFTKLIKLVQQDKLLLKDLLNPYFSETVKVFGDSSASKYPFNIPIYHDVNVIFGDKGSGKSEILKSLKEFYSRKLGDQVVYFEAGKEDEWFNEQTKNTDADYLLKNVNVTDDCSSEIKWIKTYKEITPTNLSDYKMYFSKSTNNKAFERMLIKDTPLTNAYDPKLKKYKQLMDEYNIISNFNNTVKTFESFNSLDDTEKNALSSIINKMTLNAFQLSSDEWIVQKTSYLFDDMIEHVIEFASEDISSPVMPTSTKFVEFFRNRLTLRENAIKLLDTMNSNKIEKVSKYIGSLSSKGSLSLWCTYRFFSQDFYDSLRDYEKKKCLKRTMTMTNLKSCLDDLKKIKDKFSESSIGDLLENTKTDFNEKSISSLNDFLLVVKNLRLDGNNYEPSKGEKSILALQCKINEGSASKKSVYLIDEPDLSLGNTYINDIIVPMFRSLGKQKKIIVITTHDGNIAIRTRPLNSILKLTNNNVYKTYTGNMFTDELINIDDNKDILSWKIESIKYLEGGKDAFDERSVVYE